MYKLISTSITNQISTVQRLSDNAFIPFDLANTDYVQFKNDVTECAELQDADGVVMAQAQVDEFLKTIP